MPLLKLAPAEHSQRLYFLALLCTGVTLLQVPIVIRGPGGVGRQLGAEHSQRLESYFQSIPGVQLVACSTVANSKALLKSAIRSDNPIIFFEHVLLYNVKGRSLASCASYAFCDSCGSKSMYV